jgi:flavodoxin
LFIIVRMGTRRAVGEALAEGLRESGVEVDVFYVKDVKKLRAEDYDFLVLGSPTKFGTMSFTFKRFLGKVKDDWANKPFAAFDTENPENIERSQAEGAKLVKQTLAQAGTPYVETVAVMAKYTPFFEKAGMQPTAESKPNPHITATLEQLSNMGFNPTLLANTQYNEHIISEVGCKKIITMLEELSKHHPVIRRRLAGLSSVYPKHKEFTAKIREFNAANLALALKRLSFMTQTKVYLFWKKQN